MCGGYTPKPPPNIRWTINPRGPCAPPLLRADGVQVNISVLEHLDLYIHLIDGRLETDVCQRRVKVFNLPDKSN